MRAIYPTTILAAMTLVAASNAADAFCLLPDPPSCLTSFSDWEEYEFNACRSAMTRYKADIELHMSCISDEYSSAVKKFNCKTRREAYCL